MDCWIANLIECLLWRMDCSPSLSLLWNRSSTCDRIRFALSGGSSNNESWICIQPFNSFANSSSFFSALIKQSALYFYITFYSHIYIQFCLTILYLLRILILNCFYFFFIPNRLIIQYQSILLNHSVSIVFHFHIVSNHSWLCFHWNLMNIQVKSNTSNINIIQ